MVLPDISHRLNLTPHHFFREEYSEQKSGGGFNSTIQFTFTTFRKLWSH